MSDNKPAFASAPINVHVVHTDGSITTCECIYRGRDGGVGVHVWQNIRPVTLEPGAQRKAEQIPENTTIVFEPLPV